MEFGWSSFVNATVLFFSGSEVMRLQIHICILLVGVSPFTLWI